jgi:substrate import-associated zinc metallohydrolase lipoprotein
MKKILIYLFALFLTAPFFTSCDHDGDMSPESVIVDKTTVKNEFDKWLEQNYTIPYNIDFRYRSDDREYSMDYTLVPPTYEKSVAMAKILLHLWLGTYNGVKGINFTRIYIPKTILLVGSGAYKSTSTVIGEAEGGMKITFYALNDRNLENPTVGELVGVPSFSGTGTDATGLLKTAFHEFAHILDQNKSIPESFALISDKDYMGDDWNATGTTPKSAQEKGFITKYASSSPGEDFAEIVAIYTVRSAENWSNIKAAAGADGAAIINSKVSIINNYLRTLWGTSLDEFREAFENQAAGLDNLDLVNLN